MNYLLKNGNAHLKNFGVLYDNVFKNINFAPAYDIVNTVVYIYRDKPALTMFGKKVWWGKEELVCFGVVHCYISQVQATKMYEECIEALKATQQELKEEMKKDKAFQNIGLKMLETWNLSFDEKTHKELPLEIIRNWNKTKRA